MPLIKSASRAAIGKNIAEMESAGHPRDQAIAASLRNAREYGKAGGGGVSFQEKGAARALTQGFLHSNVPGRTDKLPISVGGGAYVLPADHVAALGQGNSLAGANIVNKMFKMGPYGTPSPSARGARAAGAHLSLKPRKFARGGTGEATPIIAAGGEIVIPPDKIEERFGNLDHGHKALDHWVVKTRKKHIRTLRKLKPPKKD